MYETTACLSILSILKYRICKESYLHGYQLICLEIYQHGHLRESSKATYHFELILVAAMLWFRVDHIFYICSKFVHEKPGSSEATRKKHPNPRTKGPSESSEKLVSNLSRTTSNCIGICLEVGSYRKKMQFPAEWITLSGFFSRISLLDGPRVVAAAWQKACP